MWSESSSVNAANLVKKSATIPEIGLQMIDDNDDVMTMHCR